MGYESKLYIVEKTNHNLGNELKYAQLIAVYDLCKMNFGHFHRLLSSCPATDCYIYADDGNTRITEDNYGSKLKEMPIDDLITALQKDDDGYRRIKPLIALLKALKKETWKMLTILHYGY